MIPSISDNTEEFYREDSGVSTQSVSSRLAIILVPFAGLALTLVLAAATRGLIRWLVLALVPLLTLVVCYTFAVALAENGNMLFVALFRLLVVLLAVYYPCLLLVGVIVWLRRRKADAAQRHSVSSP